MQANAYGRVSTERVNRRNRSRSWETQASDERAKIDIIPAVSQRQRHGDRLRILGSHYPIGTAEQGGELLFADQQLINQSVEQRS